MIENNANIINLKDRFRPANTHYILVIGVDSPVGRELLELDWPNEYVIFAPNSTELSITDPSRLAAAVKNGHYGNPWLAVINCLEFNPSRKAEGDEAMAWLTNAVAPAALGQACAFVRVPLIQLFSDATELEIGLDGKNSEATLNLTCGFDASKSGGAAAIRQSGARHAIFRAHGIIGRRQDPILRGIARQISENSVVNVRDSSIRSLTSSSSIAEALAIIAIFLGFDHNHLSGSYTPSIDNSVSFFELVQAVSCNMPIYEKPIAIINRLDDQLSANITDISVNSAYLDATQVFGLTFLYWKDAVSDVFDMKNTHWQ